MSDDIYELECTILHETSKAYLVQVDDEDDVSVWLPKSEVEVVDTKEDGTVVMSVPGWLAEAKEIESYVE